MEHYLYDAIYQLLEVAATKTEAFGYDAVGNRLAGPGGKGTAYLYNGGNQMIQGRKLRYAYDYNGNQTSKTVPGTTGKSWLQTWDYENQLVKVEKVKGAEKKTVSFDYDTLGRRIGKQVTTVIGGVTKVQRFDYVYDYDNIVLQLLTDERGTTKTFFTHGLGVDEHLAMETNAQFSYYLTDGLGSVVALTDRNQKVIKRYEYESFGMLKYTAVYSANSYTYTGREWDKEIGLYYFRTRYYDPIEGMFINKDPLGYKGGINLYSYVLNNPINLTDPYGLEPVPCSDCDRMKKQENATCKVPKWEFWVKNNACSQALLTCGKNCDLLMLEHDEKAVLACRKKCSDALNGCNNNKGFKFPDDVKEGCDKCKH